MVKRQNKMLLYSFLLFLLSAVLLFQVSLGWFTKITQNEVAPLNLTNSSVVINFFQGVDEDSNGVPDRDVANAICYTAILPDNIIISNVYPLYTVAYKAYYNVTASGGYCNLMLKGLSPPDTETPTVDIARAMRIKYTDPATSQLVDSSLYDKMDASRNVLILNNYHLGSNGTLNFEFLIYMDGSAGNEYKNKELTIDKFILSISQG